MNMSRWQRIKRRFSLMGGSYVHPDGTLELDFDEKAGIDRAVDSEDVQWDKLRRYEIEQRRQQRRRIGTWFLATSGFLVALHLEMPTWQAVIVASMIAIGIDLLFNTR